MISIVVTHRILDDEIFHLSVKNHEFIEENTYNDYELIFIDNGSYPPAIHFLATVPDLFIRNGMNVGNAMAWDQGIDSAKGDIVILMDNDVWVEKNWDKEMVEKLVDEDVGIAFPHSIVGDEYDKLRSGFDIEYRARRDGFCFAFRKDTYKKAGRFYDRQPFLPGYYEDDWFAYRVQYKLGLKLIGCPTSRVWHKGQATTKKMWSEEMAEGIEANKAWYEKLSGTIYPNIE